MDSSNASGRVEKIIRLGAPCVLVLIGVSNLFITILPTGFGPGVGVLVQFGFIVLIVAATAYATPVVGSIIGERNQLREENDEYQSQLVKAGKHIHDYKRLCSSLQELFGKTEKLRNALSHHNLRCQCFDDSPQPITVPAIEQILHALRIGMTKLSREHEYVCTLIAYGKRTKKGKELKAIWREGDVDPAHKSTEDTYLHAGRSMAVTAIGGEAIMFQSLEEARAFHTESDWPRMGEFVQSGILWPIVVDAKDCSAVLQITSSRPNGFAPITRQIAKCTANVIGTLLEVRLFFLRTRKELQVTLKRIPGDAASKTSSTPDTLPDVDA